MARNKLIIRALLIISFLGINALILFGISTTWAYMNTGADRASRLHLELELANSYLPKIIWDTEQIQGRPIELQTLRDIEKDYISSWNVKNNALATNDPYGISDYYTDSARIKMYHILKLNKENHAYIKQTSLEHSPQLEFYNADGTLITFTDNNVITYRETYVENELVFTKKDTATFKVIMLLEDGFWRIRHLLRVGSKKEPKPKNQLNSEGLEEQVGQLKGLNYYPKDSPWDTFGENFDADIIGQDFLHIRKMGLNTVRVFVPYEDFGKASVASDKLEKLNQLLDKAEENNLKVIMTLFDFYGDYRMLDWTLTHRHAEQLVTALKDHKALFAWDIKNEPDLDFDARGKKNVLDWLQEMSLQIKKWDTKHPVTVGWSNTEVAVLLADQLDFVSFHYYKDVSDFTQAYSQLQKSVPNKALLLQEYGISSYNGIWNAFTGSETDQADYYKEMQGYLKKNNIPYLFWTLYDFNEVPKTVVGKLPWRKNPQHYFGCLDSLGNKKTSYKILSNVP